MRKRLKNYLTIGLISLGLFLFLELLTRLFWNQEIRMETEKPDEHPFVLDSQTYTFRNNPGVKYQYSKPEWSITCAINKEGMRDPNTYLDKPRDTTKIRVLAIGDSFTFGEGSEIDDTWLSRLEKSLRPHGKQVEIIKAGVSAFDQWQEYYYLKQIIGLYKPDYVLLGFLPNDLMTNKPLSEIAKPENVVAQDHRPLRFLNYIQLTGLAKEILLKSDGIYRLSYQSYEGIKYLRPAGKRNEHEVSQYKVTANLLGQIDSLCRVNNAPLIVVSLPQFYEVISKGGEDIDYNSVNEYFVPVAKEKGFAWVTTLSDFRRSYAAGIQTHFRSDGHLTPKGNEVLANSLKPQLEKLLQ